MLKAAPGVPRTSVHRRPLPSSVRWLAVASSLAATADTFVIFAVLWVAGPWGWSGAQVALFVVVARAPSLLGGVLGGRAVDRFGARPLLLFDAAARSTAILVFVVAGAVVGLGYPLVLAMAATSGALAPITYAAARTLVPRLVPGASLGRANALLSVGDQLVILAAAGLVGPALTVLGPTAAFLVSAVLMTGVGVIAFRLREADTIPASTAEQAPGTASPRSPWRSGSVLTLVALSVAYYFAYGPFETVLPHFVRDELQAGANTFSLLWLIFGIGAVAGLALAPRLAATSRPGIVNAVGATAWGLVTLPLLFTESIWVALPVYAVSGVVWGPYTAVETTALQRWTPATQHGRLFGTQRALLQTVLPLGAALGALAIDHTSAVVILGVSLAGCSMAGLVALALPPTRRKA